MDSNGGIYTFRSTRGLALRGSGSKYRDMTLRLSSVTAVVHMGSTIEYGSTFWAEKVRPARGLATFVLEVRGRDGEEID